MAGDGELWIFGYGSLMWRPDFAHVERRPAMLARYHRCFCIVSTHHRGTPRRPGLVLGLDRGGACQGVAYRVADADAVDVLAYLRQRELVNGVYREVSAPVMLLDESKRDVRAITYIVERCHPSYARTQPLAAQATMIRSAHGLSGNNLDYLINTVRHLQTAGIRERALERLVAKAAPHVAQMAALTARARVTSPSLASPCAAGLCRVTARMPLRDRQARALARLRKDQRRRFLYRLRLTG